MRLDFNVLWVDDQPDNIASLRSRIQKIMRDEGFEFKPTICQSVELVRDRISDNVFCDEIDLVLVDWDLGADIKGQDVIQEVRTRIQYKDVVFYSALTNANELRELAFGSSLEGVFCASRAELVDEVVGVFESLVKKVLDLDHTRGIVMGATSDIDLIAGQCLTALHDALDGEAREAFVRDALARIANKVEGMSKRSDNLHASSDFAGILKEHMLFTANDRLRMLSAALKQSAQGSGYRGAVTTYMESVVPKRNDLGHQVLNPTSRELADVVEGARPITVEEMRELRCTLLDLRSQFRELHAALVG